MVWRSANPPSVKCFHQGGLNGVLYSLDVLHSYPARQDGDKPPVFVPEEVLNQFRRAHEVLIILTSTLEPGIVPGLS